MSRCTKVVDVSYVIDCCVVDEHRERIEKYLDLATELQVLWNTKVEIVPLIFGVLGVLHGNTVRNFELLQLNEDN